MSRPPLTERPDLQPAVVLLRLSAQYEEQWGRTVDAALRNHGDGDGKLISGVYRSHFPETVKTGLRDLIGRKNATTEAGFAARPARVHWATMRDLYRLILSRT